MIVFNNQFQKYVQIQTPLLRNSLSLPCPTDLISLYPLWGICSPTSLVIPEHLIAATGVEYGINAYS